MSSSSGVHPRGSYLEALMHTEEKALLSKGRIDAATYQRSIEEQSAKFVTSQHRIVRMARVRVSIATGGVPEGEYLVRTSDIKQRWHYLVRKGYKATVHRCYWGVVEEDGGLVQQWNRIDLARAHRDGLNYHFAKWLLTKDL
jgi:hypothetical protein